jgi:hypothetical protein
MYERMNQTKEKERRYRQEQERILHNREPDLVIHQGEVYNSVGVRRTRTRNPDIDIEDIPARRPQLPQSTSTHIVSTTRRRGSHPHGFSSERFRRSNIPPRSPNPPPVPYVSDDGEVLNFSSPGT